MATLTITLPAVITITNTTSGTTAREIGFIPYKENFTSYLGAGDTIKLEATTSGQVLYYLAQATDGLSVEQAAKAGE